MSSRTGHWLCRLDGYPELDTDQLRLREVVVAERVTGLPYTLLDPRASSQVALSLFALMLIRAGEHTEEEALVAAEEVELKALHNAFEWVAHADEPLDGMAAPSSPPGSAATSTAG